MAADHTLSTSSGKVVGNAASPTASFTYPQRINKMVLNYQSISVETFDLGSSD
jgi:hypothetical protein